VRRQDLRMRKQAIVTQQLQRTLYVCAIANSCATEIKNQGGI